MKNFDKNIKNKYQPVQRPNLSNDLIINTISHSESPSNLSK